MLPPIYLPGRDAAFAVGLIAALGLATGIVPAVQARRLKIVDALRKH
jgi:ABC-type antimicrobial peptide transport system permease subunit